MAAIMRPMPEPSDSSVTGFLDAGGWARASAEVTSTAARLRISFSMAQSAWDNQDVIESGNPAARVLSVDLGKRRIGLAISDEAGLSAQPLDALQRRTLAEDLKRICSIAKDRKAQRILVGLPLHLDGRESAMSEECRRFAGKLGEASGLPVSLHDERLTSVEAEEMLRARGWSLERLLKEKKKGTVDRLAAAVLLEDWMSAQAGRETAE